MVRNIKEVINKINSKNYDYVIKEIEKNPFGLENKKLMREIIYQASEENYSEAVRMTDALDTLDVARLGKLMQKVITEKDY